MKPNQDKIESKFNIPPAPDSKPTKHFIENDINHSQQQFKKLHTESLPNKRPPNTQEYETSFSYSQRPVQKNLNQVYGEAYVQNKLKFLPHIKLRDSSIANTFIPVLPSFLTELK